MVRDRGRLRTWPGVSLCDAHSFQNAAVDTAEDLAHEGDGGVGDEVGSVDVGAAVVAVADEPVFGHGWLLNGRIRMCT